MDYGSFAERALTNPGSGPRQPRPWQRELAEQDACGNRLIRIPTGFGKTLGVLMAWLYHRTQRNDDRWPRRLVWCLPMRVLAEQTESEVRQMLVRLGLFWESGSNQGHAGRVGVHLLMGGSDESRWYQHPEHCAVLIGTQDMLLSRAMNRGYAAPRARWPLEFGLLNQDCLWVMDEVQLMDVGLATSGQLQSFRDDDSDARRALRPSHTWWMSATLQRSWLAKSPETAKRSDSLPQSLIAAEARFGELWTDVFKAAELVDVKDVKALAADIRDRHIGTGKGALGPTLVVVNTVERAVQIATELRAKANGKLLAGTDIRLIHSRFRGQERAAWRETFLNRAACEAGTDRIIIATQVVEAGVDLSAALLFTELAPWPSLVQRFGRCARWGGNAQVIVADFRHETDKAAAPYSLDALEAARIAIGELRDVSPLSLESFEDRLNTEAPERLAALYPYEPRHLLLRHEIEALFDTAPDLSGADIDIGRYIRNGIERDVRVFWISISPADPGPVPTLRPARDALCAVPAFKAQDWLFDKAQRLAAGRRAWVWDWLDGEWKLAERRDLYPGQVICVDSAVGGYSASTGWTPLEKEWHGDAALDGLLATPTLDEQADSAEDDEALSEARFQTIAFHGQATGTQASTIATQLGLDVAPLLDLAGRWHDVGKSHAAFQNSIGRNKPNQIELAKAPKDAWAAPGQLYRVSSDDRRPGFRHELASTLAMFALLRRHEPEHEALLGPHHVLLKRVGRWQQAEAQISTGSLAAEIGSLSADAFNLVAYLICSHHGKVRMSWHASPKDQAAKSSNLRIHGVEQGEQLPSVRLGTAAGENEWLPGSTLDLSASSAGLNPIFGASWTERVLGLLKRHGPFALAYLEALLRIADQRASADTRLVDPLLRSQNEAHGLDPSHSRLESTAGIGEAPTAPGSDPTVGIAFHDDGRRAGNGSADSANDGPPASGTRYIETRYGVLSNAELAPLVADRVAQIELTIQQRAYAAAPLDDRLILDLHRRVCADLLPDIAGRWRLIDVQVGSHQPPPAHQIPELMRNFADDLTARVQALPLEPGERLLETLAFAEGRLLHIHPFADFNGRVTRLLLSELLTRLDLPIVNPAAIPGPELDRYLAALRAYDARDNRALIEFWRQRFSRTRGETS